MKIKKILVSQPEPQHDKNPYFDIAEKNNVKIDFRPFIHVEPVPTKEFRKQRISILEHSAVIFTSKTAIDNFFRVSNEMRITVPDSPDVEPLPAEYHSFLSADPPDRTVRSIPVEIIPGRPTAPPAGPPRQEHARVGFLVPRYQ